MRTCMILRSQLVALCLLPVILGLLAVLYVIVVSFQGRPFLHRSRRMRDADTAFWLYKIRTMTLQEGARDRALGGDQMQRVTRVGRFLRQSRLDELPQIFNILQGHIGFIGPRPPLPGHVAACPRRYRRLLAATRPGVTGLSTVFVHRREERILSRCRTAAETERAYRRFCLPAKLRLDMIYAEHRNVWLDMFILWWTVARLFPGRRKGLQVPSLAALPPTAVARIAAA